MRSLLTLGLSDRIAELHAAALMTNERLGRIEDDIASLRTNLRTRDERAQKKLRAAMSSLVNVISVLPELNIRGVLPPFPEQGFSITGEEAAFFYHLVRRQRPKLIVELGCGSSTILFAAAQRATCDGRVISVEHDREHAERTRALLAQAELADRAEVVFAPLVDRRLNGRSFQWYDLDRRFAALSEKIDLLFVDGPPGKVQSLSRYPALPVLLPHLAPRATVIVDDGQREDEIEMVEMWRELDGVSFTREALDFLPHAPLVLTMAPAESRVTELRLAREERSEAPAEVEVFAGRRSGTS